VLQKHLLALNRPCLFVDQVQAHNGVAMRNNSESISELLLAGIKKVIELATPAHGRPTNEQSAIKRILLGSVSLYLQLAEGAVHGSGEAAGHQPSCYCCEYCDRH
jgi:hypothetical protein